MLLRLQLFSCWIEVEEIHQRFILMQLHVPLLSGLLLSVEYLQVVRANCSDAVPISISLIQSLSHALAIIKVHSPVMHQLYSPLLQH